MYPAGLAPNYLVVSSNLFSYSDVERKTLAEVIPLTRALLSQDLSAPKRPGPLSSQLRVA